MTDSRLRVRYAETDRMGVAYHTHYLVWCEVGRTDFMRALGTTYAAVEAGGLFLAVSEAEIRYGAAARYDDEIRVRTRLEQVQSRAVTFGYEVLRDEGGSTVRLATARTRLVSIGRDGVPRALPRELLERFREVVSPPST